MCWVLHVVGTLKDAQIPHEFNSVFILSYALFES